jgi:hypothetical protein
MNNIINLCASLILTLLGFVLPILTILLSLFSEGTKALTLKYENEKKQSDENITSELKKKEKGNPLDYAALEKTLKILKKNKKNAEKKLSYLKPSSFVIKISLPLAISFVCLVSLFYAELFWQIIATIIVIMVSFIYSIYFIWKSLAVLIEVSVIVSETKRSSEDKIIELLSNIANKNGDDSIFLKPENINIKFNNEIIQPKKQIDFAINISHEIPISIINSGDMMAKNVEIGFIFPSDFLVEKTTNIDSLYAEEERQIIRLRDEFVRGSENKMKGKIKTTFLKAGVHEVTAFIKGENVKNKYIKFFIKVVN